MPSDKLFGKDVTISVNHLNMASPPPPTPPTTCVTCIRFDAKPKASANGMAT